MVEVAGPERVVWPDLDLFLEKHRSRVQALVRPEDRQAGLHIAIHNCPVEGAWAPMQRQKGGMVLNRAKLRRLDHLIRHDVGHKRHHAEICVEGFKCRNRLRGPVPAVLMHRHIEFNCCFFQRVKLPPLAVGRRECSDDLVFACFDTRFEHSLAERRLADNRNSHWETSHCM